jgi:hypothetical protein
MRSIADIWSAIQGSLFPFLEERLPEPFTQKQKQLTTVLEVVRIEDHVEGPYTQIMGRPQHDRRLMARAFIAKAVYDLPSTELLVEMLKSQPNIRRLCGWERFRDVPSASTFSRAFDEFSVNEVGKVVHTALVKQYISQEPVMHVSRDSTAVVARESVVKKEKIVAAAKKQGRPKKGEERPAKNPSRLQKQLAQTTEDALDDLPKVCDWGAKKDTGGHMHCWKGWKAHIDWADGGLPLLTVTTSASVHDSQLAIPMMRTTAERVKSCYDLMDSAYDVKEIREVSAQLGHVALIDPNPRRSGVPEEHLLDPAMLARYKERSTAERGNSRLKDEFGLRHLRVRGHPKAHLHIMFGILALFADQLMKPLTR